MTFHFGRLGDSREPRYELSGEELERRLEGRSVSDGVPGDPGEPPDPAGPAGAGGAVGAPGRLADASSPGDPDLDELRRALAPSRDAIRLADEPGVGGAAAWAVSPVERSRPHRVGADRPSRGLVLRDALTILGGAVLAVLIGELAGFGVPAADLASPTPAASTIVTAETQLPSATLRALSTLGPIVNPIVVGGSPTPVPIVTLPPPTPTPVPTPIRTVPPGPTPRPTATPKPTPKPTAKPTPTPAPPVASFDCTALPGLILHCDGSTSVGATSWSWDWGDNSPPPPDVTEIADHTYAGPGLVEVTLTVTGPGGTADEFRYFTVTP